MLVAFNIMNTKLKFQYGLLALFVVLIMIDPTNKLFHVKEPVFILLMAVTFLTRAYKMYSRPIVLFLSLFLCALTSLLFAGLIYDAEISGGMGYLRTLLFFSVFIAISKYDIEKILKLNFYIGVGLALLIDALYAIFILEIIDPNLIYIAASEADNTIMISKRSFLGIEQTMFFYKTMPFVFFALIYALRNGRWLLGACVFVAIWTGGSRTPILCALAIISYVLWSKGYSKSLKIILGFAAVFGLFYILQQLLSSANQTDGDIVKMQTIKDFQDSIGLFGHGPGLPFYSKARGMYITSTEMTYFEILFHYGIVLGSFVIFIFFKPAYQLVKSKIYYVKDFGIAFILYLVNAGTNPLLINSTGLYVFATAVIILEKYKIEKRKYGSNSISNI